MAIRHKHLELDQRKMARRNALRGDAEDFDAIRDVRDFSLEVVGRA